VARDPDSYQWVKPNSQELPKFLADMSKEELLEALMDCMDFFDNVLQPQIVEINRQLDEKLGYAQV